MRRIARPLARDLRTFARTLVTLFPWLRDPRALAAVLDTARVNLTHASPALHDPSIAPATPREESRP